MSDRNKEIKIEVRDSRRIEIPVPCGRENLEMASDFITACAQDGYKLTAAAEQTAGHQRDPYVVGVVLYFEKKS